MFRNVYKGRRVFVTGHTGFKGSWLCFWLERLGAEVTGIALPMPEPEPPPLPLPPRPWYMDDWSGFGWVGTVWVCWFVDVRFEWLTAGASCAFCVA